MITQESVQLKKMNILKDISKEKLVIVVSHDEMLANKYADRIIRIVDGKVDYYPQIDNEEFRKSSTEQFKKFISKLENDENLRVFASGENLLTFTDFSKLSDPELVSADFGKTYPLSQTFSLGLSVTF